MALTDKMPELEEYFLNASRLFVALARETNADTVTHKAEIVHHESGDKYEAVIVVKKIENKKKGE